MIGDVVLCLVWLYVATQFAACLIRARERS